MLKIHSGSPSSQQTVLTIPANQLKQLGVGSGSGGLQTILMPVGKGEFDRPLDCQNPCGCALFHPSQINTGKQNFMFLIWEASTQDDKC